MNIVDERLKTYAEMSIGQYFYGNDNTLFRKLDATTAWNETSAVLAPADSGSAQKFVTITTELHIKG